MTMTMFISMTIFDYTLSDQNKLQYNNKFTEIL